MIKDMELESLVSIFPIGIVFVDENRKITFMNPYARDVIIGNKAFGKDIGLFHTGENKKQIILDYFSKLSSKGNVELPIVKIFNLNNRSSLFIVRLTKMYDQKGDFKGIVAIFYDLTSIALKKTYDSNRTPHTVINKLPVIEDEKIVFLDTDEIIFIRSVGSSTIIFDNKNNKFRSNLKISELEEKLVPKNFFRCHRSYLVNLSYVKEMHLKNGKHRLYLNANKNVSVPVSRRNISKIKDIFTIS